MLYLMLANPFRWKKKQTTSPIGVDQALVDAECKSFQQTRDLINRDISDSKDRQRLLLIAEIRTGCRIYFASPNLRHPLLDGFFTLLRVIAFLGLKNIEAECVVDPGFIGPNFGEDDLSEGQSGADDVASKRTAGDYTAPQNPNSHSAGAAPNNATSVSSIPREGFVPGALAKRLGLSSSSLGRYADLAQVARPKRGQKNRLYPLADVQKIATAIIARSPRDEKAAQLLRDIDAFLALTSKIPS